MSLRCLLALALALCTSCGPRPCTLGPTEGDDIFDDGIIVVRFESTVATQEAAAHILATAQYTASVFLSTAPPVYARVEVPADRQCEAIDAIEALDGVDDAFVNIVIRAQ